MTARPQALIIGGSVGGLMAASLLRGTGWDVTLSSALWATSPAAGQASAFPKSSCG